MDYLTLTEAEMEPANPGVEPLEQDKAGEPGAAPDPVTPEPTEKPTPDEPDKPVSPPPIQSSEEPTPEPVEAALSPDTGEGKEQPAQLENVGVTLTAEDYRALMAQAYAVPPELVAILPTNPQELRAYLTSDAFKVVLGKLTNPPEVIIPPAAPAPKPAPKTGKTPEERLREGLQSIGSLFG